MQEIPLMLLPFALITDPRRQHPTTQHKLFDLIAITLCAALCGAKSAMEYEDWGLSKEPFEGFRRKAS